MIINTSTEDDSKQATYKLSCPIDEYDFYSSFLFDVCDVYSQTDCRIDVTTCKRTDETDDRVNYESYIDQFEDVDIMRMTFWRWKCAYGGNHEEKKGCPDELKDSDSPSCRFDKKIDELSIFLGYNFFFLHLVIKRYEKKWQILQKCSFCCFQR